MKAVFQEARASFVFVGQEQLQQRDGKKNERYRVVDNQWNSQAGNDVKNPGDGISTGKRVRHLRNKSCEGIRNR